MFVRVRLRFHASLPQKLSSIQRKIIMKDQTASAQVVLPCRDFDGSLRFFTERLGFRVEMISPADAPVVAVVSGYGLNLRLETSAEKLPPTLRLIGDFSSVDDENSAREITSPDGVRVVFADRETPVEIPDGTSEFVLTVFDDESSWERGRAGMLYRDLIPGRLGGRFVASHISIPEGGAIPDYVHYHKVRFQMIYCISGWARLVYENQGAPFLMRDGDCILQPPEIRHRVLESSAKFEVLEVGCPAIHETFADHALNLPNEAIAREKIYGSQRFLHHVGEKSVWRESDIKGFQSRDTGIGKATDGLADARIFRADTNASFSVNHRSEFLFFFILEGNLRLRAESAIYNLNTDDCFVLPGDGQAYSVDAEKGLELIRIALPALDS